MNAMILALPVGLADMQALKNLLFNQMKHAGGLTRGMLHFEETVGYREVQPCIIWSAEWTGPHQLKFEVSYIATQVGGLLQRGLLELDLRERTRLIKLTPHS